MVRRKPAKKKVTNKSSEDKVIVLEAQEGKQKMALNLNVDVMIYGGAAGSGKSRLLLLKALKYAWSDPDFSGVLFRKNTTGHRGAGGLFSESLKLFTPLKPRVREKDMEIRFENTGGGLLKYNHLERDSEAHNHQGLQYSMVGFDELTHFTQYQFIYLISRLRSESKTPPFLMATCNPDPDSWVLDWVLWYLDDEGYPRPERCGIIRYFLLVDDKPVFADTEQELVDLYPDLCYQKNDKTGEITYCAPATFTFIGGTIFDNPALIESNPQYLAKLKAQSPVNRARLLDGCWFARAEGSNNFQREWLTKVSFKDVPKNLKMVRAWDKAYQEPSEKNRYPDFTASVKMGKDKSGNVYIFGDYTDESMDPKTKVYGRFQKRAGERDIMIKNQAYMDGRDCIVVFSKDPAGGEVEYIESAKKLTSEGFIVHADPVPHTKSKIQRFLPFSSACQNGSVYIVEESFINRETLDAFYKELEAFDGSRSSVHRKDDWPDAAASCFNFLSKQKVYTAVSIPNYSAPTIKSNLRL